MNGEENKKLLNQLSVQSVSIGGDVDNPFVVLCGKRLLMTRKVLNLCCPGINLGDEEFPFSEQLDMAIQAFLYEVEQYIIHKKRDNEEVQESDYSGNADDPFSEADITMNVEPIAVPENVAV